MGPIIKAVELILNIAKNQNKAAEDTMNQAQCRVPASFVFTANK